MRVSSRHFLDSCTSFRTRVNITGILRYTPVVPVRPRYVLKRSCPEFVTHGGRVDKNVRDHAKLYYVYQTKSWQTKMYHRQEPIRPKFSNRRGCTHILCLCTYYISNRKFEGKHGGAFNIASPM